MKLTTTRNMLTAAYAYDSCLKRFDQAYPNIDPDQELSLLDMLTNEFNTVQDVIWCLRATKQDSKSVSVEFAKRCATRAADAAVYAVYTANASAGAAAYSAAYSADYSTYWDAAAYEAAHDAEREKQKHDLMELLS